ncbi:MAG: type IX secretion system sortase PorU, partial [Bacteroidia bacterium]|nr:type IX secretion system sortase PorU [Bacteroidia bacterium]
MRFLHILTFLLCFSFLYAGNEPVNQRQLEWGAIQVNKFSENEINRFLYFKGATYNANHLPEYYERIKLPSSINSASATITNAVYAELNPEEAALVKISATEIKVNTTIGYERKEPCAIIQFIPIRKNESSGKYEKLLSFNLVLTQNVQTQSKTQSISQNHALTSVLASGKWFRIGVTKDGIYKMSYSFLKNLGIDISSMDPRNIRLYGNGGGQLPYANSSFRRDDLTENSIIVQGESDGVFDSLDYVLFYGQGPTRWTYFNSSCAAFRHQKNNYSDTTYYFITTDFGNGKRIAQQASLSTSTDNVTTFDDYAYIEEDLVNLLKSGREWYGFNFDIVTVFNTTFNFPNIDASSPATIKTDLLSRYSSTSSYVVNCGAATQTISALGVPVSLYYGDYASNANGCLSVPNPSSLLNVTVSKQTSGATGWLNYIEANVRRQLNMYGEQMIFRDSKSVGVGKAAQYTINTSGSLQVWEVSDPTNVKLQVATNNITNIQFIAASDSLREFIAFTGNSYYTPSAIGAVPNQNLHALPQSDMVIIAHPLFWNEANTLANFHRSHDNMTVTLVTPQQVYNEFSSGAQDVSAIRDFMKMFYDRSTGYADLPKYLLLFGDGSYDNKYRLANNTNYIPTYQSDNSHDPTASYVSDDYYGLLDDSEGNWTETAADLVDIGIGRLPADNVQEAQGMVNKIIKYSSPAPASAVQGAVCNNIENTSPFGDWRNVICFIGDDEDNNTHISQANQMATLVNTNYKNYNVDKIYFDAYAQETTPGGNRYPDVTDAITKRVLKGALIMNYTGHGGETGWAHERVIDISTINDWGNVKKLPLFVTATCEFSRYDDPARTSAGE